MDKKNAAVNLPDGFLANDEKSSVIRGRCSCALFDPSMGVCGYACSSLEHVFCFPHAEHLPVRKNRKKLSDMPRNRFDFPPQESLMNDKYTNSIVVVVIVLIFETKITCFPPKDI